MGNLGYTGITITKTDKGYLMWYAGGPEISKELPSDILDIMVESPDYYHNWLSFWNNKEGGTDV